MRLLKFYSSINLWLFVSLRDDQSTYIKDFNCSWSTNSSHSRADIFIFLFICSKEISSLIFVGSTGTSCCFGEDFHPFTLSFIISTRLLILYLRIPIYSYSLLLPFISSFMISTWLFLLHLRILIPSTSLLLPFNYSFITSTLLFILCLVIPISSSSLMLASLHCGILT